MIEPDHRRRKRRRVNFLCCLLLLLRILALARRGGAEPVSLHGRVRLERVVLARQRGASSGGSTGSIEPSARGVGDRSSRVYSVAIFTVPVPHPVRVVREQAAPSSSSSSSPNATAAAAVDGGFGLTRLRCGATLFESYALPNARRHVPAAAAAIVAAPPIHLVPLSLTRGDLLHPLYRTVAALFGDEAGEASEPRGGVAHGGESAAESATVRELRFALLTGYTRGAMTEDGPTGSTEPVRVLPRRSLARVLPRCELTLLEPADQTWRPTGSYRYRPTAPASAAGSAGDGDVTTPSTAEQPLYGTVRFQWEEDEVADAEAGSPARPMPVSPGAVARTLRHAAEWTYGADSGGRHEGGWSASLAGWSVGGSRGSGGRGDGGEAADSWPVGCPRYSPTEHGIFSESGAAVRLRSAEGSSAASLAAVAARTGVDAASLSRLGGGAGAGSDSGGRGTAAMAARVGDMFDSVAATMVSALGPAVDTIGMAFGGPIGGTVSGMVGLAMMPGLSKEVGSRLTAALPPSLQASLVPSLAETVPAATLRATTDALTAYIVGHVEDAVAAGVVPALTPALTARLRAAVTGSSPANIAATTAGMAGPLLVRSLTSAIVPALAHVLGRTSPDNEAACDECRTLTAAAAAAADPTAAAAGPSSVPAASRDAVCQRCRFQPTRLARATHYAAYYGQYYSDYFVRQFASSLAERHETEAREAERLAGIAAKYRVVWEG